jgi:hypothetical protein
MVTRSDAGKEHRPSAIGQALRKYDFTPPGRFETLPSTLLLLVGTFINLGFKSISQSDSFFVKEF